MQKKYLRSAAAAAALCMLLPAFCISAEQVTEDPVQSAAEVTETEVNEAGENNENTDYVMRTENEVLKTMTRACENENLILFYSEEEDLIALENKKNGYVWWSSPVNAEGDPAAKATVKKELESSLVVVYGDPKQRTGSTLRSARNSKRSCRIKGDTLEVTYRFPLTGFVIPVKYTLEEKCLRASADTASFRETKRDGDESSIILELSVLPNIMAAGNYEKGYYIIPDGCGAKIDFNNGKTGSRAYSAKVYGTDITAVPQYAPDRTEEVYLPVYASVKENGNAMLAVISRGDSNVLIQASVSGLNKSSYNTCSSRFVLRNSDTYYMNSEPLTVFENSDIGTDSLELKFFPTGGRNTGCAEVAAMYRQYLIDEQEVEKKNDRLPLCIDLYGGVTCKEPFLGVPVTKKKAVTTFEKAGEIVSELRNGGAGEMIVSLENWTDDGIKGKVDVSARPSRTLGGEEGFRKMTSLFMSMGVRFCPAVNNITFSSGNGYWEFSDTAMRASGQYSKQIKFSLAYGTKDGQKKPQSLLSPAVFPGIFNDITTGYCRRSLNGICPGEITTVLYGDYGKKHIERCVAEKYICDGLQKFDEDIGFVYSRGASAYAFGYTDHISDVPLRSSGYDIFDGDLPFYQLVLHGLIPYSSTSVNGDADPEKLILMAASAGSGLRFDLTGTETSELKDTEYDKYFYADSGFWSGYACRSQKFITDILSDVKDEYITDYTVNGDVITTVYSDGTVMKTDLSAGTVVSGSKTWVLDDYLREDGGAGD
ncbi:DUF5696 domain-containing protein [Ruminococcus sp. HUN007]|uniref:DUF5696 domain-containing protein n=1 Tax=Ruminococcus sp. HUN007 TaxID=1514668 RepID=UPI0005D16C84|nr:DUF5696 domain-containing protein [Ruminococcus sp. HUN007]